MAKFYVSTFKRQDERLIEIEIDDVAYEFTDSQARSLRDLLNVALKTMRTRQPRRMGE